MTDAFYNFLDNLTSRGLEYFRSFYGVYRGVVVSNQDPQERGRIQAHVPPFGKEGDTLDVWIDPVFEGASTNRGSFTPPQVGDLVRVVFEIGNPGRPVAYFGGWHGQDKMPADFSYSENGRPEKGGFISRMGNKIIWSDEDGNEYIRIIRHKASSTDPARSDPSTTAISSTGNASTILLEPNGDIRIVDENGSNIHFNAEDKQVNIFAKVKDDGTCAVISMTSAGINLTDSDGNIINTDGGDINIIAAAGDVNVNAKMVNIASSGTSLSNGANDAFEPVIKGLTYTAARAVLHTTEGATHTAYAAAFTAISAFLSAYIVDNPPPKPSGSAASSAITPIAAALIAAGTMTAALGSFESASATYLSLKTKTA